MTEYRGRGLFLNLNWILVHSAKKEHQRNKLTTPCTQNFQKDSLPLCPIQFCREKKIIKYSIQFIFIVQLDTLFRTVHNSTPQS